MKSKIFIISIISIAFYCCGNVKRTPESILSEGLGFKLPANSKLKMFNDEWNKNPSGDGSTLIIYEFDRTCIDYLTSNCLLNEFSKLPIIEKLPDNYIYKFICENENEGFYRLEIDTDDKRDYNITVIDFSNLIIIYYNVLN